MGLNFTPITLTNGGLIRSDDLNSNFLSVMNAPTITGNWLTAGNHMITTLWDANLGISDDPVLTLRPSDATGTPSRGMLYSAISSGSPVHSLFVSSVDGTTYAINGMQDWFGDDYLIYNGFTGSGTGVVSHGWPSGTPKCVSVQASGGSATGVGYDSLGSTTVNIYCSGSWNSMAVGT